jgi:fatty-acyl-CoA synthase
MLRNSARRVPDREALVGGWDAYAERPRLSYRELLRRAEHIGGALAARYAKGTHIAVWSPNSLDWVVLQMAAALAGLPLVMLGPNLRRPEAAYILGHSQSVAVFAAGVYRDSDLHGIAVDLKADLPALENVYPLGALTEFENGSLSLPEVTPDECALILYTSGTTGSPKGVLLSHRAIVTTGRTGAEVIGAPGRWLLSLPLASVGGSVFAVMGAFADQSTLVVMRDFDPALLIRLIDEERITFFNGPTTVHLRILDHPAMAAASFDSLKSVTCGGSTVNASLIERIEAEYGAECLTSYGLSEASGTVNLIRPGERLLLKSTTVGRPIPEVEVSIRAPESRLPLPAGSTGEICVRSPGTMIGYFAMPEATGATIEADGWLRTGDLGSIDDAGYLTVTGRLKDMIKRGGHNVYPREVEDLLARHPAVAESAVFGLPHPELGEEIAAAVRLRSGQAVDGETLSGWLFPQIAPYKIPRTWHFVDSFPTNANGKIQKFRLRELFSHRSAEP